MKTIIHDCVSTDREIEFIDIAGYNRAYICKNCKSISFDTAQIIKDVEFKDDSNTKIRFVPVQDILILARKIKERFPDLAKIDETYLASRQKHDQGLLCKLRNRNGKEPGVISVC